MRLNNPWAKPDRSSDHYPYFILFCCFAWVNVLPCGWSMRSRSWYTIVVKECTLCWRAQAQSVFPLGLSAVDVFLRTRFAHMTYRLRKLNPLVWSGSEKAGACDSCEEIVRLYLWLWKLIGSWLHGTCVCNVLKLTAVLWWNKAELKHGIWPRNSQCRQHLHSEWLCEWITLDVFSVIMRRQSEKRRFGWD